MIPPFALASCPLRTGIAGNKDDVLFANQPFDLLATEAKDVGSVGAVIASDVDALVQDLGTLPLGNRLLETGCKLPDNGMSFTHSKPHMETLLEMIPEGQQF